ncbi:hypothetical protein [Burkholderia sp. S171]|uniref:hypothetical protein n=1 Tax=Burkholderia sp. S171 TaxID=1641860 RepID=UPI00131E18BA|nr:hypothetical protein [Burkholderia sp. S171]
MNLLSFRTPILYPACHRCGNALTRGEEECPHCGTNQSRALRAPNSGDFNNGSVMMMSGHMLVPYPSVPDEVDAAMNIARERARVVRRVAFGVAGGGLLAAALALTYAPGLRSPVVQRLAALPEPATTPAFVPVVPDNAPKAAAPASTTTVVAAAKPAPPVSVSAAKPPAATLAVAPAATYVTAPAPRQTPTQTSTQTPTPAPTLAPASNPATEMIASLMKKLTATIAALRTEISTVVMSPATEPVTKATLDAPAPIIATTATTPTTTPNETNAPSPVAAPVSKSRNDVAVGAITPSNSTPPTHPTRPTPPTPPTPVTLAQNTASPPLTVSTNTPSPAPVISTPAPLAALPPAPSPNAVADVPIASHAPQPSTRAEQELPKLSLPPVSPVIATERPPVGSPEEGLYFARVALATNNLSAAHQNLANVPANQVNSPDVQRVRDDLAQREAARDVAMQHARVCGSSASWRCARRYAKDALAIDSSYTDSRVFLKHVASKIAEAKKAAEAASVQTAAITQRSPMHAAPIREAVVIPRTATTANASTGNAPTTTGGSAPHLFANPVVRAPRETHATREARETHSQQEVPEPVVEFQPNAESSESKAPDNDAPIRPAGRGEAH